MSWHAGVATGRMLGVALLALLLSQPLAAGDESSTQGWFEYQYRDQFSERLRISWGVGYRELLSRERDLDWSRFHLRTFLTYSLSPLVSLEAGIGGIYSVRDPIPDQKELRTWQGTSVRWPEVRLPGRRFPVHHRVRLEQRWIDRGGDYGSDFDWRMRYRLAFGIPLNDRAVQEKTYYLPLATEYFWDLGENTAELFASRLRATVGLGYVIGPNWALELRYTRQSSRGTIVEQFETNDHIVDLRIRTALRLRDLALPW